MRIERHLFDNFEEHKEISTVAKQFKDTQNDAKNRDQLLLVHTMSEPRCSEHSRPRTPFGDVVYIAPSLHQPLQHFNMAVPCCKPVKHHKELCFT